MKRPDQAKRDEVALHKARFLYRMMPGAPTIPSDGRGDLWGEVEDNDHFRFCHAVAKMITNVDPAIYK